MLTLKKILFINLSLIFLAKCKCTDYCSAGFCNNSKQHTLCKYKVKDPASTCLSYERTIFNDVDRQKLLNKINNRRNKVAAGEIKSLPSAAGMMRLRWNSELELSAQRWADQCVKHDIPDLKDTCRDLAGNIPVGQNIATVQGDSPGLTPSALVDVWYMELLKFNSSIISRYVPSYEIGESHYDYFTQLVWEDSLEVGCGGVKFQERVNVQRHRAVYRLVCNFAPGGNRRNKTVYSCGAPCSACTDGVCDPDYKALCGSKPGMNLELSHIDKYDEPVSTETSHLSQYTTKDVTNAIITRQDTLTISDDDVSEQESMHFDYIHHLFDPKTRRVGKATITGDVTNKEALLNDFIDLLKKKLGKDAIIKDLLSTTVPGNAMSEISFTDKNVAAFVNRIYSTKEIHTTTKTTANDYVNSTLLVDLIEAVIFRSNDKMPTTEVYTTELYSLPKVKPIKIQAELPEVKQNREFTGHYFFPEEDESTTTETTEIYYDNMHLAQSDIEMEIESLRMSSITRDFLDEIFESDTNAESTVIFSTTPTDNIVYNTKIYNNRHGVMQSFLKRLQKNPHQQQIE